MLPEAIESPSEGTDKPPPDGQCPYRSPACTCLAKAVDKSLSRRHPHYHDLGQHHAALSEVDLVELLRLRSENALNVKLLAEEKKRVLSLTRALQETERKLLHVAQHQKTRRCLDVRIIGYVHTNADENVLPVSVAAYSRRLLESAETDSSTPRDSFNSRGRCASTASAKLGLNPPSASMLSKKSVFVEYIISTDRGIAAPALPGNAVCPPSSPGLSPHNRSTRASSIHHHTSRCKHRYNHFRALHSVLSKLFKRYAIPALPASRFFGKTESKEEIDERRKQLEIFLRQCVAIDEVATSVPMERFLASNIDHWVDSEEVLVMQDPVDLLSSTRSL
jgi:hypothetical protein